MKYIKLFESFENEEFVVGDIVRLTNADYLSATNARMNNVNINDVFKIVKIDTPDYNHPIMLNLLKTDEFIAYVGLTDIEKLEPHEIVAIKYNL